MRTLGLILTGVVAALHFSFLILEMVLWDRPMGRRVFRLGAEQAVLTKTLAANQGLYNGFLGAGLIWGLVTDSRPVMTFFLICVVIAGTYGAATVNRRVLWVQALPAAVAIVLLWL